MQLGGLCPGWLRRWSSSLATAGRPTYGASVPRWLKWVSVLIVLCLSYWTDLLASVSLFNLSCTFEYVCILHILLSRFSPFCIKYLLIPSTQLILSGTVFASVSVSACVFAGTGKAPWPEFNNNLAALFHVATLTEPPPFPSHLSKGCCAFLSRYPLLN